MHIWGKPGLHAGTVDLRQGHAAPCHLCFSISLVASDGKFIGSQQLQEVEALFLQRREALQITNQVLTALLAKP